MKTEILLNHVKIRLRSFACPSPLYKVCFSPTYLPPCGGHTQVKGFFRGKQKDGYGPEIPEERRDQGRATVTRRDLSA